MLPALLPLLIVAQVLRVGAGEPGPSAPMVPAPAEATPAPASPPPAPASPTPDAATPAQPIPVEPGPAEAWPAGEPPTFRSLVAGQRPLARDASQDVTLVSGDRLRNSTRASTFEALSQESGDLYVSSRGGGIHGVGPGATGGMHLRGLGGSPNAQVLVVVDGAPDYQGIFGHPIPDAHPALLLDEALIVKGGDSVLYGSNAMAGAIVLRSRWRRAPGYELSSDVTTGSFGTLKADVALLGRWAAWDGAGGLSVLQTDGERDGAGGGTLTGQLGVRRRVTPSLTLALRERLLHLTGGDPGPVTHPTPDHSYEVWRQHLSLQVEYRAGAALRLSLGPYLAVGWHHLYDGFASRDTTLGASGEAKLDLGRGLEVLLGLAGERVDGEVEDRVAGTATVVAPTGTGAGYGQISLRPAPWLTAVLGGRALYSSGSGFLPLYKAGLRVEGPGGLALHARAARNYRQPTLRELYLPFPVANPELQPEESLNLDLGASFETEHLLLACTGYRTQATHLIRYFGTWPAAEVINIDRVVISGISARAVLRELGPFELVVAGDWQDVGRYTRQNPEAKLNVTLDSAVAWGMHRLQASLSGEWVHGLYGGDYGRRPLPDPCFVDLALRDRYAAGTRKVELEPYLVLRNLLDRRDVYVEGYPMPGRSVQVGLRMRI